MAWNEPGGGNNQDPWGGKRGNDGPPDLDEALKKFQEKIGRIFGGSGGGSSSGPAFGSLLGIVAVVLVLAYAFFGVHIINEQERGVVLRLGVFQGRILNPGLNWVPPLIDKVDRINVTLVRRHEVNGNSMITGDLNIVEVDLTVQWNIDLEHPEYFVLNVSNPEESLREATDSAVRHVVGSLDMDNVLTEGRSDMGLEISARLQDYLDNYGTGIRIRTVNIEETTPPDEVRGAFDDVNKAREDEEREKNVAQAYANGIIPEARGRAKRMIEEANGYREQVVSRAQGEAERFERLLAEYEKAPQVTRQRLYLDAVEQVMSSSSKIMVDIEGGNNMMYLPLDKIVQPPQIGSSVPSLQRRLSDEDIRRIADQLAEQQRLESGVNNGRLRGAR